MHASFHYRGLAWLGNQAEVTFLCLGQLTKLLVLPVNVVSFLTLTVVLCVISIVL